MKVNDIRTQQTAYVRIMILLIYKKENMKRTSLSKNVANLTQPFDSSYIQTSIHLVPMTKDQPGSFERFIRHCRHDIEQLPKFRPKRPSNFTDNEFSALQSLHARNDIVIKPAAKGVVLVVWRAG
jgi:hypothetical protein